MLGSSSLVNSLKQKLDHDPIQSSRIMVQARDSDHFANAEALLSPQRIDQ
jgi:hypothetical protein